MIEAKFNLGDERKEFYELLKEEDFNFKTKKIEVEVRRLIVVNIKTDTILNLKIGVTSLLKSLEVIDKTKKVIKNGKFGRYSGSS